MTQKFLEGLPIVPLGELPTDSTCMICLNTYGTESPDNGGIAEGPVRLPCDHHVGSACITIWLSPDKTAKNSCPYCRAKFFPPAQIRPQLDDEDNEDDEPDSPAPGNTLLEMTGRLGRIGRPVQAPEGSEEWDDYDDEGYIERDLAERDSQGEYAHFFQRTAGQYEESLERARAIVTKFWQSEPHAPCGTNNHRHAQAMERAIADLANSFRTLPFREIVLYIRLMIEGPRSRFPRLSCPMTELNREQEEALFLELERQGAFARDRNSPVFVGLTNRERWQLHRERNGEVWDLQAGDWAGFGAD
ncbi:MAG: hypothetical protein Q9175_000878 [Cornicularia normoerica]